MATTTTTDLNAMMKILFEDTIVNNVVRDTELVDQFEAGGGIKVDTTTGGRYIETAQLFGLPAGVGARAEGGYIPVPKGPIVENSRINLKKILGAVEMTAETLKMVRTRRGAFANWGKRAMPSLVQRVTHELDRMLLGYGEGILARVNDATPATNLVVDACMGIAGLEDALFQFLAGGQLRASSNSDGSSPRSGVMTISDVDHANGYIVVDALATSLANDDYLFPGDSAALSAGLEPMGLFGMVDDGGVVATFQNIARASYSAWRGQVIDAQGSPFSAGQKLTEEVLIYADDSTYNRGGGKPDLIVTSRQGARQYWADLKGDRSLNDPRLFMGGGKGVGIMLGDRTVKLKVARKMPRSVTFGLTRKTFKKWMLHRFEWDDTTGAIWRQVTDGTGRKDAFYAYGSLYCEFGCLDPQKNFRIDNIYDSAF